MVQAAEQDAREENNDFSDGARFDVFGVGMSNVVNSDSNSTPFVNMSRLQFLGGAAGSTYVIATISQCSRPLRVLTRCTQVWVEHRTANAR
jgi:hypothetical protein